MQRLFTAVTVYALLIVPATTHATAYTWTGIEGNGDWQSLADLGNWNPQNSYPGQSGGAGDTATIATTPNANPCYLAGSLTDTLAWVDLDADTANGTLELELRTNSSMTVTEYISVAGDAGANYAAMLQFNAGTLTFSSADLDLLGGDPGVGGRATCDLVAGTFTAPTNITMQGDSLFQTKFNVSISGSLVVVPEPSSFDTTAVVNVIDANETVTVEQVQIGGANYPSQLEFQGFGKLQTQ